MRAGYRLIHPKCAFTGRMLFPGRPTVAGADGRLYVDETARRLGERDAPLEEALAELGPQLAHGDLAPAPGQELTGPAVVEGMDSTAWVPTGATATVDETGSLLIELPQA